MKIINTDKQHKARDRYFYLLFAESLIALGLILGGV